MTSTQPDTSKIEEYVKRIGADRIAVSTLIHERPGQYTVIAVVASATDVGIPTAEATRLGDLFAEEAKIIRDAEFAIVDALKRQEVAMKKILARVTE